MAAIDRVRTAAQTAWDMLLAQRIPATPRNFEIWYAYCGNENPALRARIDELMRAGGTWTPGVLDSLYREFFDAHVDIGAIRDGSRELYEISGQIADRLTVDRGAIDEFASVLNEWAPILVAAPTEDDIRRAIVVLRTVTTETGERFRALEQLFTASILRIGDLKRALIRAETAATRDVLTGLANRRLFDAALAQATAQCEAENSDVALLLLDIDHFKQFNDKYGHPLGDHVLRLLARVLTDHIKGRDTAARYGGEEFAIILVGAGTDAAMTVAGQIRALLEQRPIVNRTTGQKLGIVTCSIGVAVYRPGEALGDFIDRADTAMYQAKRTGRNRVCAESPR